MSVAAWAASEWMQATADGPVRHEQARASFTLGALALVVHSGLALHLRHAWSQADAMGEIARQTAEVTGLGFSGGLFVN